MSLHMITSFDTADYNAWRDVFDGERKGLGRAGLHPLKVLHEAETPNRVWILFEVDDKRRAEAWIEGGRVTGDERSGITGEQHMFLETA